MLFRHKVFWAITSAVTTLQLYVLLNDSYWNLFWGTDKLLHILWGLVVFLFFRTQLRWKTSDALLGTISVAILFEAVEMTDDFLRAKPWWPWHSIDNFYWDGAFDVLTNTIGGLIGIVFMHHVKIQTQPAPSKQMLCFVLCSIPLLSIGFFWANDLFATAWIYLSAALTYHGKKFTSSLK